MRLPGAVILDVGCFKHLESPEVLAAVRAGLKVADLQILPTAANGIEAASTENPAIRQRLLAVLRTLARGMPLLPDPHALLRQNAKAVLAGKHGFICEPSGLEWLLEDRADLTRDEIRTIRQHIEEADASLPEAHAGVREQIQQGLKQPEQKETWTTPQSFLDEQWMTEDQLDVFLDGAWERLGLGDPPAPRKQLLQNPAWRLYMEGIGISIYRGAIARQQGRLVQHSDLMQLVYLGGRDRSILVSTDRPFVEAASDVLAGRYPGVCALLWADFIALQ